MEFEFLVQNTPNLSIKEAEYNLDSLLKLLGVEENKENIQKRMIRRINSDTGEVRSIYKYTELRKQIRNQGICDMHEFLDNLDPVFDFQFAPSTTSSSIKSKIEWEGYTFEFQGPCKIAPSEWELSSDIEFYKDETCIEFNSGLEGFELGARNYRGYIFSSLALVDAYINRHIKYYSSKGMNTDLFNELKDSKNIEERIDLFVQLFCDIKFDDLKQTKEWDYFKKIQTLRNNIIHAIEPYFGYSLKEISANLNYSILGVGGLLKILQTSQGKHTLKFIEKIRNSAKIDFQWRYTDKNGEIKIKRKYNKISR